MALLALKVAESRYPSTLKNVEDAEWPVALNAEPAFNSLYKINNIYLTGMQTCFSPLIKDYIYTKELF